MRGAMKMMLKMVLHLRTVRKCPSAAREKRLLTRASVARQTSCTAQVAWRRLAQWMSSTQSQWPNRLLRTRQPKRASTLIPWRATMPGPVRTAWRSWVRRPTSPRPWHPPLMRARAWNPASQACSPRLVKCLVG